MIKKIIASTISKSISSHWYPNNGTPAWNPVRTGLHTLSIMTDTDTTPGSVTQMLNLNSVVAFLSGITNDAAYIGRAFMAFDLTSLAGLTLTNAKIAVQCISSGNGWPNPQDYQVVLTRANFSNPIVIGDWSSVIDTPLCPEAPMPFATGEAVFTLNNAGITYLNNSIPSGLLKVAFRFSMDVTNSQPSSFTNIQFWFYNQNKGGSEPYLEINVPGNPSGNIPNKLVSEGVI